MLTAIFDNAIETRRHFLFEISQLKESVVEFNLEPTSSISYRCDATTANSY